jgi:flagellar biosynthesis/type III secretory pathway protein FliH
MDRGDEDKIQRLEICYHRIYESGLTDDEKSLLVNFTRTYNRLAPEEAATLRERLDGASNQGVREMEYSYFGQARQARQEGWQEGQQEGQQEGRQEGMHLMLLEMLQEKFGELPLVITDQVRAIESQDELTTLATRVRHAESLADLGLNGTA